MQQGGNHDEFHRDRIPRWRGCAVQRKRKAGLLDAAKGDDPVPQSGCTGPGSHRRKNARESRPTINEMADMLQAGDMHYQNEAGTKGSWPKLDNLKKAKNETRFGAYRRITLEAYKGLCQSMNADKPDVDGGNPVILEADENSMVSEGGLDAAFSPDLDNDDEDVAVSFFVDPA
jgi:hypothetical protein